MLRPEISRTIRATIHSFYFYIYGDEVVQLPVF